MKFMTWNIKDGGALDLKNPQRSNIGNILEVIKTEKPDVAILQEYQSEFYFEMIMDGLNRLSYTCSVCTDHPDRTLRKRVLIASKIPFHDVEPPADLLDYSRRNWREIVLNPESAPIHILGVHVPSATTTDYSGKIIPNSREKRLFLKVLKHKFVEFAASNVPCLVCGDFNLHSNAEYSQYLEEFSDYLTDITSKDATYGGFKLDYIFANNPLKELVKPNAGATPHATNFSDHKYLCVETA